MNELVPYLKLHCRLIDRKTHPVSGICIHKLPNNQKSSIITNKWYNPTTYHAIDLHACSINQNHSNMIDIDQSDRGEVTYNRNRKYIKSQRYQSHLACMQPHPVFNRSNTVSSSAEVNKDKLEHILWFIFFKQNKTYSVAAGHTPLYWKKM